MSDMVSMRLEGGKGAAHPISRIHGASAVETFQKLAAHVIARERLLDQDPQPPQHIVQAAGPMDVPLLHLALPVPSTLASDIDDAEWRIVFAHLVFGRISPIGGGWAV